MKIIYTLLVILSVLLTGCSEDKIMSDGNEQKDGTITVYFNAGSEVTTRSTHLLSSDNRQHAKYVHLYVFNHAGLCVQSKNVNWTQEIGATATQSYTLKGLEKGQTYTLLAVGLDEEPGTAATTYGLPDAITENTTTLTGLMATLVDGKTKDNIATSELFSGWEEVTAGTTTGVTINLYRRVAGVLAYLKGIPSDVATIQIKLYTNQYKNVPLQKADKDNKNDTADHGDTKLDNSEVLISIPVNSEKLSATSLDDGHGEPVTKQPGTVLQGAYVLPVEAPATGNYTLTLETLNAVGAVTKTYNIKMLTSTEHGGATTETTNYPLHANQFYSIGKKNATTDEPVDIGGDKDEIYIEINPNWSDIIEVPIE